MADSTSYILVNHPLVPGDFPNYRTLNVSGGLSKSDTGAEGVFTISTTGKLAELNNFVIGGLVAYDTSSGFVSRTLTAGIGITITNPSGQGGNPAISLTPSSSVQLVHAQANGGPIGTARSLLNFIPGTNISITAGDDSVNGRTNITINNTEAEGAPTDATYILQKSNVKLPNAQSLGDLTNGLLKVSVTDISGGVISTAVANTDYQAPSPILTSIAAVTPATGTLLVGNGTGFEVIPPGDAGTVLTSEGTSVTPSWQPPSPGSSSVIILPNPTPSQVLTDGITYIPTNVGTGAVAFSLPTSPTPGDVYQIKGYGDEGWTLSQNASQTIKVGTLSTTPGTSGSIAATFPTDGIIIYCITATQFTAEPTSGQVSIV